MTAKIFNDVFTANEINQLIDFYDTLPIANTRHYPDGELVRHMKNSEYNLPDQLPYKIINPTLTNLLGEHCFTGGH